MTPVLPERLDWPSAIGNLLINFSMLDYLVFKFLESRLPPDQWSEAKGEPFKARIRRIEEHVRSSAYPTELRDRFTEFFARVEPVRELRNHIAHGLFFLHQVGDTKEFVLTLALPRKLDVPDSPEFRHLDYAQLEKSLASLTELVEAFKQLTKLCRAPGCESVKALGDES